MDSLNNLSSRKVSPAENMARLEKAVAVADQRIRMRREMGTRVSAFWGLLIGVPLWSYVIYHCFAPHGVMQNHKQSSGAYMYWASNFMYRAKTQTQIYRPEQFFKETTGSLQNYSRKIKAKRAAGELEEGQWHPETWH